MTNRSPQNVLKSQVFLIFAIWGTLIVNAQNTEIVTLSGTGFDHPVEWDFYCTAGANSGTWTTIEVPSCWEQKGFGQYNYGHVPFNRRLKEEGHYRHRFEVHKAWRGKHIELVFEGVMTDARVLINGKQAGEVHQGAFYRFNHDISRLLNYGKENTVEVLVKKHSDNISVNEAERMADYWIFGGIFRPVYLEVKPAEHIVRVAVDARADGVFRSDLYTSVLKNAAMAEVGIQDLGGRELTTFSTQVSKDKSVYRLEGMLKNPETWSPEFPNLYIAQFRLKDENGLVIHQLAERIGFRTVEVRDQDGIYVNGERIKYKGVCRHTFHPDHGRTSCKAYSIEVVNLLKDMNMNAVRMSHYPPDGHFLDVCDSLGLFVLDELAGWQRPPYDSVVGKKLLEEMVAHDVNHPSVVMWDNANEGGWNTTYDNYFKEIDIQQREVNHPWAVHEITNTAHYVDYNYLARDHFAPRSVFFPTEMIHGLYDGGHGAGLEDFWLRMWNDPLCAGGFLWVFADESVKRTDTGTLDSDGNHAPDGILGPYHEKEGSFYAIREIWSPIHMEKRYITPEFNGKFRIQNRFHYTGLEQCSFSFEWVALPGPGEIMNGSKILQQGFPRVDPLEPGQMGVMEVAMPDNWQEADVLYVEAHDPHGRLIHKWSWPVRPAALQTTSLLASFREVDSEVIVQETAMSITLESGDVSVQIMKKDGRLDKVTRKGDLIPLSDGPLFRTDTLSLMSFRHYEEKEAHHVVIELEKGSRLEWVMQPGGLLEMKLDYQPEKGDIPFTGASFNFPEEEINRVTYLGNGPYRVWKNRMKGVGFNVWEKEYNNTITGHSGFEYPEFKGYYSNMYWASFTSGDTHLFTVCSKTDDLFLRLFTPEEAPDPARTAVQHPPGDLSFMLGIPAIGTKFKEAEKLGPQSRNYSYIQRRVKKGALNISLTFDFR